MSSYLKSRLEFKIKKVETPSGIHNCRKSVSFKTNVIPIKIHVTHELKKKKKSNLFYKLGLRSPI